MRRNKANPKASSSWLNRRLTADCDRPMRVAAPMVEPVDMIALKASSCLRFTVVFLSVARGERCFAHSLMRISHNVVGLSMSR